MASGEGGKPPGGGEGGKSPGAVAAGKSNGAETRKSAVGGAAGASTGAAGKSAAAGEPKRASGKSAAASEPNGAAENSAAGDAAGPPNDGRAGVSKAESAEPGAGTAGPAISPGTRMPGPGFGENQFAAAIGSGPMLRSGSAAGAQGGPAGFADPR